MSVAVFAFGVFVFLITVYGTVVTGSLLLTDRQLDETPELMPQAVRDERDEAAAKGAKPFVPSDY